MSAPAEPAIAARLERALLAFRKAQELLLMAHRRLKGRPLGEVERFWATQGRRLERHLHATAAEVVTAFKAFSAAGLVASAHDRHWVSEAHRHLADGD
jgi:hypothetical protein